MIKFAYPRVFLVLFSMLSLASTHAQCPDPSSPTCCENFTTLRHVKRPGVSFPGTTYFNGLLEFTPAGYNPSGTTLYPLIIYFHGVGEVGPGTNASLCNILTPTNAFDIPLPERIEQGLNPSGTVNGNTYQYIVLSPQYNAYCPDPLCVPANFPSATDVHAVINYAVANYKVDHNRIYLVGMSSGSNMIVEYASGQTSGVNNALRVAAIGMSSLCSPVSRSPQGPARIAQSDLPFWEMHCAVDDNPNCPDALSTEWVTQINSQVPPPDPLARKTTLPGPCAHNTWNTFFDPTYTGFDGRNIYNWLIQYARTVGSPLPATIKNYGAMLRGGKVYVEWTTTVENNSERFVLERAGSNGIYQELASATAAGVSNTDKKYALIDEQPAAGVNYYRLVLVNRDGKKEYYDVKRVTVPNGRNAGYVNIPAPVKGTMSVYVNVDRSQNVQITIHDLSGKTLHRSNKLFTPGLSENRIDVTGLPAGTYFVKVAGQNFSVTKKIPVN